MTEVMVGTVASPSLRNEGWKTLQSLFLSKSESVKISKFVSCSRVDPEIWASEGYTVVSSTKTNFGRAYAIMKLVEYFKESNFDWLLLLDSDAFPFAPDWFRICTSMMENRGKFGVSVVRHENFENTPSPCVFFVNRAILKLGLSFDAVESINPLGDTVEDITVTSPQIRDSLIPLIRTNKINYHPLFGGTYGRMFYHHGAGNLGSDLTRVATSGMCDHFIPEKGHSKIEEAMFARVQDTPKEYLNELINGIPLST
jgi:hypothetical protein